MLKNRLIIILLVVIGIIVSLLFIQKAQTKKFKEQAEDREAIMKVKERDWVTKEGRLVHENSVVKLQSDKVTKELFKNDSSMNSLLKDLNVKVNKMQSFSRTSVSNHYHVNTPVTNNGDSTYKIKEWKNPWLTVSGEIDLKKNIASLDYDHKDTIIQVIHYKRSKKFLGLIPYGKFEFVSQTTTADTASKVVEQVTYIKNK